MSWAPCATGGCGKRRSWRPTGPRAGCPRRPASTAAKSRRRRRSWASARRARAFMPTQELTHLFIRADPYAWPFDGDLRPANTALLVIDMQTDFCGRGGYVDKMGYDLALTRAPVVPIKNLL